MARNNKSRFAGWVLLMLAALWIGGCTSSMQARSAYEDAERYAAEEKFDRAVEKYFEAAELNPGSKTYKLKLISSRTRAAAAHVKKARTLVKEGEYTKALAEYRLARGFDPSIEVANQEAKELQNLLEAERLAEEGAEFYGRKNPALARAAISKALSLDANNARALAIKDLLDKDQKTITMDGIELDVASSEPITLRFKDANIKEVFGILSQLSGINFIFDEDIRSQAISVLLEKASFAQAMELIMQMNGLGKKVLNGKTIIIYPQTRDKEKQYEDQLIQTFYLSHIDAKKAVNMLRTMLQLRKIYVHEERNALVVRDKPEVIRLAEKILNAADRENSEVILALELVSVSDIDTLDIGTKLSAYSAGVGFSKDGVTPPTLISDSIPESGDLSNLVQSLNGLQTYYTVPSAVFNLAKTLTSTEILASPKIRVRNREKAKVHVGTREPVITTTTTDTSTSSNIQYVDVGIKLDVEPNIQLNNSVETKLKLEVSQVISREEVGPENAPITALTISTTNAETVLTLKDGVQTIIGGLFEQLETKQKNTFPIIGDIPILGALVSGFSNRDNKREILLSITPYIVKQVEVPELDVATIWSGGEDNLKSGPNFGAFAKPLLSEVEAVKPLAAPAVKPATLPVPENGAPEKPAGATEAQLAPPAAATENAVLAEEKVVLNEEAVPTEELPKDETVGAPLVLEMPAKPPAVITFGGPQQVETGKEFTMAVDVKGVEQLYSAPLFIQYDPSVLELISVSEGAFLKQDDHATVFSSSPNRTTGQVIVGYKQGTGGKGASGSGTLFNLNFKPIAAGQTQIEINRVNFRNPEGVRLQVNPEAATIEVR